MNNDNNRIQNIGQKNLNVFGIPEDSPMALHAKDVAAAHLAISYPMVSKRVRASNISVQNLIQESDTETADGSFTTGQSLVITATLTPDNLFSEAIPFGIPQLSIYQGTAVADALQIYPKSGSSINPANYIFDSGFDWGSANEDGTNVVAMVAVENIAAGAVSIHAVVKWKYIANKHGEFIAD